VAALRGVDHILHAGDVCQPAVIAALEQIAPVSVVRGNWDRGDWADSLPLALTVEFGGVRIHVVHILKHMTIDPAIEGIRLVVSGHSHRPGLRKRGAVLYVNPGTAGPGRPEQAVSLTRLRAEEGKLGVEFVMLE
jgi:putative phosphoesterase